MSLALWLTFVAAALLAALLAMGLVLRHAFALKAAAVSARDVSRLARRDGMSHDAVRTRQAVAGRCRGR